jgi:hypothetical protein
VAVNAATRPPSENGFWANGADVDHRKTDGFPLATSVSLRAPADDLLHLEAGLPESERHDPTDLALVVEDHDGTARASARDGG